MIADHCIRDVVLITKITLNSRNTWLVTDPPFLHCCSCVGVVTRLLLLLLVLCAAEAPSHAHRVSVHTVDSVRIDFGARVQSAARNLNTRNSKILRAILQSNHKTHLQLIAQLHKSHSHNKSIYPISQMFQ